MDRQKEERIRRVIITCDTKVFCTDGWNFDWQDMPANFMKEPLSNFMCGHVDSGKRTTTGCVLFELGGIPERELDKLKQDEERLEKSSLVYIFFMARQEEEWEREVKTRMSSSQISGSTPSSILLASAGEIQGHTLQHSRASNLLAALQTANMNGMKRSQMI